MLYADSSNVGTCCIFRVALSVPVRLSRLTSHSAISDVSIRGWLAAVPRCFSFEMAHTSKTSCTSIRFETESNGSREDHSLLLLCVTQCPTVVPCFFKGSAASHFSFYPSLFPLTSTCREVCCLYQLTEGWWTATLRGRNVNICAVIIHFEKLYLSKQVNCEQYNGVWFCR